MQLERVMSMMRYWPAKGTAGLARSRGRGKSRSPAPPASNTPSVSLIVQNPRNQNMTGTSRCFLKDRMQKKAGGAGESRVYHAGVVFGWWGLRGREEGTR